jgi:hydrogenase maturation protease
MSLPAIAVLGIGNILESDDGIAVYTAAYLEANYAFEPPVHIINGGVEGIRLLDVLMEHECVFILDAIALDDAPGSIYHIPAEELAGYGLTGGAHEIGVLQCLDMLALMGQPLPASGVVGIVPEEVRVGIGLSETLSTAFERYVDTALALLEAEGVQARRREPPRSLESIITAYHTAGR